MDLEKIEQGIKTTGFILENEISEMLAEKKWSIINNKYYIDDLQKTVREIDIIAYKSSTIEDISVYTSLIISCKKSDNEAWAMLSKKLNKSDPNIDWHPLFQWTNDPISEVFIEDKKFKDDYLKNERLYESIFSIENHIFAFQQMSLSNGKPQNQNNIFSAITSLMKSQNYELESLPKRKKSRCIYFFYLISIVDGRLVLIKCDNNQTIASETDSENYISNYIINGEQTSARIHFMTKNHFKNIIGAYKELHDYNCDYISNGYTNFFTEALGDYKKRTSALKVLWPRIAKDFRFHIKRILGQYNFRAKVSDIFEVHETHKFFICLEELSYEDIDLLNDDSDIKEFLSEKIESFFRIKIRGNIIFGDDIPF